MLFTYDRNFYDNQRTYCKELAFLASPDMQFGPITLVLMMIIKTAIFIFSSFGFYPLAEHFSVVFKAFH